MRLPSDSRARVAGKATPLPTPCTVAGLQALLFSSEVTGARTTRNNFPLEQVASALHGCL